MTEENTPKNALEWFAANSDKLTPNQTMLAQLMTLNAINFINRPQRLSEKQKAKRSARNKTARLSRKANRKK